MTRLWSIAAILFLSVAAFASTQPRIDNIEPYRLKVQSAGKVRLEVHGEYPFMTEGHPDMDQYEHWFIRRAGTSDWFMCTRLSDSCRTAGWSGGLQVLELNAANWLTTPGALEIRMNEGLSENGHSPWPFSNIATVPVLEAFGAPPIVVSMSKKEFVSGGPANDFVFRIAANNFDPESVMVVFRGDVFVRPTRVIDGALIEVAVPEKYRTADGELSLQVRTDRGGYSETQYFKVLKPKQVLKLSPIRPATPVTIVPKVIPPVKKKP